MENHQRPDTASPQPSGNIAALGLVSMFNDMASEMAYPVVPLFLTTTLGAPATAVGIIEGIAEATASVLRIFSGSLSDRLRRRKRFVAAGYLLSALGKVVLAFASVWTHVMAARFIDRFGKGVRSAARDALIAESASPTRRASAFGLHRAMDTAGAVIGPLLALLVLALVGEDYRLLFLAAAVPACLGVVILMAGVRERTHARTSPSPLPPFSLSGLGREFGVFFVASVAFACGNSSDAFLLLRSQSLGNTVVVTVLLYVAFNLAYSALSFPFGKLADRVGMDRLLEGSFVVFALVYAAFGWADSPTTLWFLFPAYGVYMAMSEGVGKAYIAAHVPPERKATALGVFYAGTGVATFAASVIAGLLWTAIGVRAPFFFGAVCAAVAGGIFAAGRRKSPGTGGM